MTPSVGLPRCSSGLGFSAVRFRFRSWRSFWCAVLRSQLDREGLSIRHGWRRQLLPWVSVDGFQVSVVPGPSDQEVVVYDDVTSVGTSGAINTALTGHNAALPDSYGLSPDELAWLLNQWRERALAKNPTP